MTEPLHSTWDIGARSALVLIESKRNFLDVSTDMLDRVDPNCCDDPRTVALMVLSGN